MVRSPGPDQCQPPRLGSALRHGLRCGLFLGLAIGTQEGYTTLQKTGRSWGNIAADDTLVEILRLYGTPALFEGLTCGLLATLLAAILYLLYTRFSWPGRTDRNLTMVTAGASTVLFLSSYTLFYINATVPLRRLLDGTSLQTSLRVIFGCLVAGVAVSLLIHNFHGRRWAERTGLALGSGFLALVFVYPLLHFCGIKQVRKNIGQQQADTWFYLALGLAILAALVLFWRLTVSSRAGRPRGLLVRWLDLSALLLFAALIVPGWLAGAPQWRTNVDRKATPWEKDLNVLLISVDTLRGDRVQPGSRERVLTPNIDRIARGGTVFTEAESPAPWTLPSVASMLTSLYPSAHGTNGVGGRLSPKLTTLAETLSEAGLTTKAVLANGWLNFPFGMHQGFHNYEFTYQRRPRPTWWPGLIGRRLGSALGVTAEPYKPHPDYSVAGNLVSRSIEFLEEQRQGNFFLWIHLVDPHDPYVARGRHKRDAPLAKGHGSFSRFDSGPTVDLRKGRMMSRRERDRLKKLYELEILYTDDQIGLLLDALDRLGLDRKTMIIFTADHGEEFWEHGNLNHGHSLFRELLHIPLIVRPPADYPVAKPLQKTVVRLIDVAPTILDLLGLEAPPDWQGASLLPLVRGEESGDRPSFAGNLVYYEEKKSVRLGRFKYIFTPADATHELYDLESDTMEMTNLAQSMPDKTAEMSAILEEHLREQRVLAQRYPSLAGKDDEVDGRHIEELKALGYVQ